MKKKLYMTFDFEVKDMEGGAFTSIPYKNGLSAYVNLYPAMYVNRSSKLLPSRIAILNAKSTNKIEGNTFDLVYTFEHYLGLKVGGIVYIAESFKILSVHKNNVNIDLDYPLYEEHYKKNYCLDYRIN